MFFEFDRAVGGIFWSNRLNKEESKIILPAALARLSVDVRFRAAGKAKVREEGINQRHPRQLGSVARGAGRY